MKIRLINSLLLLLVFGIASCASHSPPVKLEVDEYLSRECNEKIHSRLFSYKYKDPLKSGWIFCNYFFCNYNSNIIVSNQEDLIYYTEIERERMSRLTFVWSESDQTCVEKELYKELVWLKFRKARLTQAEDWKDGTMDFLKKD